MRRRQPVVRVRVQLGGNSVRRVLPLRTFSEPQDVVRWNGASSAPQPHALFAHVERLGDCAYAAGPFEGICNDS